MDSYQIISLITPLFLLSRAYAPSRFQTCVNTEHPMKESKGCSNCSFVEELREGGQKNQCRANTASVCSGLNKSLFPPQPLQNIKNFGGR